MFTIQILPAQQGDAIWIEYGDPQAPHRILIDCGTPPTAEVVRAQIERVGPDRRRFELLVITHIDTDHIGGILKLLANRPTGLAFDDVWFNGWRHLSSRRLGASSKLGPIDGEIFSDALDKLKWPWNAAFDSGAVVLSPHGAPRTKQLAGGMRLTVLSPGQEQLRKLRSNWITVVRAAGLDPCHPDRAARLLQKAMRKGVAASILGPSRPEVASLARRSFSTDTAVANGSSIALLAEYEGHSCLLAGDAWPDVMLRAVQQLMDVRGERKLKIDAMKVSHHGSRHNTSKELLAAIYSPRYLFSTSGAVFRHPDDEAVARIVSARRDTGCQLFFNYRKVHATGGTKVDGAPNSVGSRAVTTASARSAAAKSVDWSAARWDNPALKRAYRYQVWYGDDAGSVIALDE